MQIPTKWKRQCLGVIVKVVLTLWTPRKGLWNLVVTSFRAWTIKSVSLNLHFLSCKMGVHSPPCRAVMNRNKNVEYLFRPSPITVTTIKPHRWPSQEQWHESIHGTTNISSLSFHSPQCISDAHLTEVVSSVVCSFIYSFSHHLLNSMMWQPDWLSSRSFLAWGLCV